MPDPSPAKSESVSCIVCGRKDSEVTFSKRQRNRAIMGLADAKCTDCIQQQEATPKAKAQKKRPPVPDSDNTENKSANVDDVTTQPIPKKRKRRHIPPTPATPHENNGSDKDDDQSNESESHDVSLNALKRKILGRDLHPPTPMGNVAQNSEDQDLAEIHQLFQASSKASVPSSHGSLQMELQCAICQELAYPPVSLHCGHSFCEDCLAWWWKTSTTCPTCRTNFSKSTGDSMPKVNVALKKCAVVLFGKQLVQRIQNRKKATAGEKNGQHDRGYEILSPIDDEFWHSIKTTGTHIDQNKNIVKVRRSVVLDAQDQRMQLALSLREPPKQTPNGLILRVSLLTMEEDEASDYGFPAVLTNVEDEHFICTMEDRYSFSSLDIRMTRLEDGSTAPVGRVMQPTPEGTYEVYFDAHTCSNHHEAQSLRLQHEETGAAMDVDLSLLKRAAGGGFFRPLQDQDRASRFRERDISFVGDDDDDDDEDEEHPESPATHRERSFIMGEHDDDEENESGEDLDQFEDDGFLVDEEHSDMEGDFSDENDDNCAICKDGGELMVCDGGREMDGCGRSFHHKCVGRDAIPDGDWICTECAKSGGLLVEGLQGHEFVPRHATKVSPVDKEPQASGSGKTGRTLEDDSSSDEEEVTSAKGKPKSKSSAPASSSPPNKKSVPQKRRILEDSSSDED